MTPALPSFETLPPSRLMAGCGLAVMAVLVGVSSGAASAAFLFALDAVTALRWRHPWLLFLLPVAGLVMVRAYALWGRGSERGVSLIWMLCTDARRKFLQPWRRWCWGRRC